MIRLLRWLAWRCWLWGEVLDYHRETLRSIQVPPEAIPVPVEWPRPSTPGHIRRVLEQAHHALTIHHGLRASEGLNAYHQAIVAGSDPNGAWESFVEETWTIDVSDILRNIDAVLAERYSH